MYLYGSIIGMGGRDLLLLFNMRLAVVPVFDFGLIYGVEILFLRRLFLFFMVYHGIRRR